MNKYLELVEEFHKTFKSPVLEKPTIISQTRFDLRVNLIQEELDEMKEAYQQQNKMEILDSLCDQMYVLSGAILELGFKNVFNEAFERVHASNMSKACSSVQEASLTIDSYTVKGIETYYELDNNGRYLIFRKSDDKTLKNINYKPVDLIDLAV